MHVTRRHESTDGMFAGGPVSGCCQAECKRTHEAGFQPKIPAKDGMMTKAVVNHPSCSDKDLIEWDINDAISAPWCSFYTPTPGLKEYRRY